MSSRSLELLSPASMLTQGEVPKRTREQCSQRTFQRVAVRITEYCAKTQRRRTRTRPARPPSIRVPMVMAHVGQTCPRRPCVRPLPCSTGCFKCSSSVRALERAPSLHKTETHANPAPYVRIELRPYCLCLAVSENTYTLLHSRTWRDIRSASKLTKETSEKQRGRARLQEENNDLVSLWVRRSSVMVTKGVHRL